MIDTLREDHRNMARLLDALETEIEAITVEREPNYQLILGIAKYFCDYPELYHHPKEIAVLEQLRKNVPQEVKAIGDLIWEHIDNHECVTRFRRSVDEPNREAIIPRVIIVNAARNFIRAQRQHMRREEECFFPLAENRLAEEDWSCIDQVIAKSSSPLLMNRTEHEFKEISERLLEWEKQYRTRLVQHIGQRPNWETK